MSLSFKTLKLTELRAYERTHEVRDFEFVMVDNACKGIQLTLAPRVRDESGPYNAVRVALRYEDYSMKCIRLAEPKGYGFSLPLEGVMTCGSWYATPEERQAAIDKLPEAVRPLVELTETGEE